MSLGENIYRLRKERNLSQDALADALEVSRQSVSKWENNTAVPELEKLVKMSELFTVTLDELVGLEKAAQPHTAPSVEEPAPRVIYVEKPILPSFSKIQILGFVLLIASLLLAIALYNGRFGGMETFLMALPLVICGILCLITKHALFYSGWIAAGAYWLYLFVLSHNWEEQHILLLLGIALVIAMIVCSVHIHRKGILRIPAAIWIIGSIILSALVVLLVMNTLPPIHITGSEMSAVPVESAP